MQITQKDDIVTMMNVFDTTPEQQQKLVDLWITFTESAKNEPGVIALALHKSKDGTRVVNYAQFRSGADWDNFVQKHRAEFAAFGPLASRIDPHLYEIAYMYEKDEH